MKLGATITSERGKAVTKTGNEYLDIQINTQHGHYELYISNNHIFLGNKTNILYKKLHIGQINGSLKHGKKYLSIDEFEAKYEK